MLYEFEIQVGVCDESPRALQSCSKFIKPSETCGFIVHSKGQLQHEIYNFMILLF